VGAVPAILLAAGEGRRFGSPKQLAPLGGRPLLEHALAAANEAPVARVLLILGARAEEVAARVETGRAEIVNCEGWREGMAAPLRAGIEAARDAEAAVVMLGDQPLVTAGAIERVLAARRPGVAAVRATYRKTPGHPVLLERSLFPAVRELRGDTGARGVLVQTDVEVLEIACDDLADPLDIDTRADLAAAEAMLVS
jgi:molybdenum cofactor cytidylyltransferase